MEEGRQNPDCYYSSAVVRGFQYLWSAVVTICLGLVLVAAMFLFITCVI